MQDLGRPAEFLVLFYPGADAATGKPVQGAKKSGKQSRETAKIADNIMSYYDWLLEDSRTAKSRA